MYYIYLACIMFILICVCMYMYVFKTFKDAMNAYDDCVAMYIIEAVIYTLHKLESILVPPS